MTEFIFPFGPKQTTAQMPLFQPCIGKKKNHAKPNQNQNKQTNKQNYELQCHILSWLSSALHTLRTKSFSFYVLFTDSDTELQDINLSIFLIELVHLRSLGSFLRNCLFLLVCLPVQILFKVSCWLYFAVCPFPAYQIYKGCYTHTYIYTEVLPQPSSQLLPGYPFLLKLPLGLSGLLAFYFGLPLFGHSDHQSIGLLALLLLSSACALLVSLLGVLMLVRQAFCLWPSWHHLDALKWCHFSSMPLTQSYNLSYSYWTASHSKKNIKVFLFPWPKMVLCLQLPFRNKCKRHK